VVGSVFLVARSKSVAQLRLLWWSPTRAGRASDPPRERVRAFRAPHGLPQAHALDQSELRAARRLYEAAGFRIVRKRRTTASEGSGLGDVGAGLVTSSGISRIIFRRLPPPTRHTAHPIPPRSSTSWHGSRRRDDSPGTRLGSGQLSVLLAGPFGRVVATDASPSRSRVPRRTQGGVPLRTRRASGLTGRVVDLAPQPRPPTGSTCPPTTPRCDGLPGPAGSSPGQLRCAGGGRRPRPDHPALLPARAGFLLAADAGTWTRATARCPSRSRNSSSRVEIRSIGGSRSWSAMWGRGLRYGRSSERKVRSRSRPSAASWRTRGASHGGPCRALALALRVSRVEATFLRLLRTEQGEARARRQPRKAIAGSFSLPS